MDFVSVSRDLFDIIDEGKKKLLLELFEFIFEEINNTPWNKTSIFNQAKLLRCFLVTKKDGKDSIRNELGYHLEKLQSKRKSNSEEQKKRPKERNRDEEDLRKISVNEATSLLKKLGVSSKDLKGMTRWDLVSLIKELSSQNTDFVRYSRANQTKKVDYRKQINEVFQEHLRFLKNQSVAQNTARELEELFSEENNTENSQKKGSKNGVKKDMKKDQKNAEKVKVGLDKKSGKDFVEDKDAEKAVERILKDSQNDEIDRSKDGNERNLEEKKVDDSILVEKKKKLDAKKRYRRVMKKRVVLTICKTVPGHDPILEVITETEKIISYLNSKRIERQQQLSLLPEKERIRKKEDFEKIRQAQLKKLELNRKNDLEKESRAVQRSITKSHIRCTECGMRGHIKTNRSLCLKYINSARNDKGLIKESSLVDATGGSKIKINTAKVNKIVNESKKKGKKRYLDLTKGIEDNPTLTEIIDPCMEFRKILIEILGRVKKWFPNETALLMNPAIKKTAKNMYVLKNAIGLPEILNRVENSSRPYSAKDLGSRRSKVNADTVRYTKTEEFERDIDLLYENALLCYGSKEESKVTSSALILVNNVKKYLHLQKRKLDLMSREIEDAEKEQRLLDILKVIVNSMINSPYSFYFKTTPVELPRYKEMIKDPMWLEKILHKIDECRYAALSEFIKDCQLIVQNARAYNEGFNNIIVSAENLIKTGQKALELNIEKLSKLGQETSRSKLFPLPKYDRKKIVKEFFIDFSKYKNKNTFSLPRLTASKLPRASRSKRSQINPFRQPSRYSNIKLSNFRSNSIRGKRKISAPIDLMQFQKLKMLKTGRTNPTRGNWNLSGRFPGRNLPGLTSRLPMRFSSRKGLSRGLQRDFGRDFSRRFPGRLFRGRVRGRSSRGISVGRKGVSVGRKVFPEKDVGPRPPGPSFFLD